MPGQYRNRPDPLSHPPRIVPSASPYPFLSPSGIRTLAITETQAKQGLRPDVRLALLSFLMLFVELALIRWTGSNVLHLPYFSNFVLLGSFLGLGIGFLRAAMAARPVPVRPPGPGRPRGVRPVLPGGDRRRGGDLIFFGTLETSGPSRELVLAVIFIAVAATMAFIAEGVARTFVGFEPLEAYRLDILGSLAGIICARPLPTTP